MLIVGQLLLAHVLLSAVLLTLFCGAIAHEENPKGLIP
jgi:hypothetical protein